MKNGKIETDMEERKKSCVIRIFKKYLVSLSETSGHLKEKLGLAAKQCKECQ